MFSPVSRSLKTWVGVGWFLMALELVGFDELANHAPIDDEVVSGIRFDESLEVPFQMTDLEIWKNYMDDDLYVLDKKLREYFKKTRYRREKKGQHRTAVPLVFMWMFGRPPTNRDSQICVRLHRLMTYYCTKKTKGASTIGGKVFTHVYTFSKYATVNKRPYSLRLRIEENNNSAVFTKY